MSNNNAPPSLQQLEQELEANRLRQRQATAVILAARQAQAQLSSANPSLLPEPSSFGPLAVLPNTHTASVASDVQSLRAHLASVAALQERHELANALAAGANNPPPPATIPPSLPPFPTSTVNATTAAILEEALVQSQAVSAAPAIISPTPAAILEEALLQNAPAVVVAAAAPPKKKRRGGVSDPFPRKLHRILSEVENDGHSDIISWIPHGRAFIIREPEKFVSEIMPKYFRMSSISSLQRQLNLYNFKRITIEGADKGAYYHRLFLKGRPELTEDLKRTKTKSMFVQAVGPDGVPVCVPRGLAARFEPNFYDMPVLMESSSLDGSSGLGQPSCSGRRCTDRVSKLF